MHLLKEHRGFIVLFALAALLFTSDLRTWKEFVRAESYFALGSRLMVEQGDWLTPHAPDEQQLNKPPLTYWLIGICYKLFGAGYGSSRLPSVAAALAVLAIVYALGLRSYGKRIGLTAAAILGTSVLFMSFARAAMSDMLLTLLVTASVASFATALTSDGKRVVFAGYFAVALGVLTKGPIAVVLVALPIAAEVLIAKDWRVLKKLRLTAGSILVLVFTAPYFLAVYFRRGAGVLWFFLVGENAQRFTGSIYGELSRPFWYQLVAFFGVFAPWSILILPAIWTDWKGSPRGQTDRMKRILYLWLASTILLFSISSFKRDYYLLPAMPAAALITGQFLGSEMRSRLARHVLQIYLVISALFVLAIAAGSLKAAAILGVHSVARFLPVSVAALGLISVVLLSARAKTRAASLALSAVIAATFISVELALLPAFTRFLPVANLVSSLPGRIWITSNKTGGWANDIAFTLPPPHYVERVAIKDDAPILNEWLRNPNTVALIAESDFPALRQHDSSLRVLGRAETFGHGGVTLKVLLRPERKTLLVIGH